MCVPRGCDPGSVLAPSRGAAAALPGALRPGCPVAAAAARGPGGEAAAGPV